MMIRILVSVVLFMSATIANAFDTGVYVCNDSGVFADDGHYISFRLGETSLEIINEDEALELMSWTKDTLNTWVEVADSLEGEKDKYRVTKNDKEFKVESVTEYTDDPEVKKELSSSILTKNSDNENYTVMFLDKTFDHKDELIDSRMDSLICKKTP